mgnify:CR=1 FL=1
MSLMLVKIPAMDAKLIQFMYKAVTLFMSSINTDLLNEFDLQQFISEQSQFYEVSSFLSCPFFPYFNSSNDFFYKVFLWFSSIGYDKHESLSGVIIISSSNSKKTKSCESYAK